MLMSLQSKVRGLDGSAFHAFRRATLKDLSDRALWALCRSVKKDLQILVKVRPVYATTRLSRY